ncbi:MAG: hypothetical protein RR540_02595 [Oscillospiraceae bacterium]
MILDFINTVADSLKWFFFGDFWFITFPIAIAPFFVFCFLEIRRTLQVIKKQKQVNKVLSK